MEDIAEWCDEHLPELYDSGMYEDEVTFDRVWEHLTTLLTDTIVPFVEHHEEDHIVHQIMEHAEEWFRCHHTLLIEALEPCGDARLQELISKPQTIQHSPHWYAERMEKLTASEFAHILDGRFGSLLRKKLEQTNADTAMVRSTVGLAQPDGEMNSLSWGHRFEPIVRRIYERETSGKDSVCDSLGRFTHNNISWLSASPDGIVLRGPRQGRLLEIKAPKTRKPGQFIPFEYYVQMQIQMEVCDVEAVDFVEAQFSQQFVSTLCTATTEMEAAKWKGRIDVYGRIEDNTTWCYRYSDPVTSVEDITKPDSPADTTLPLLESSVWWLTGWSLRTVLRNQEWWEEEGRPAAEVFWGNVRTMKQAAEPPVDKISLLNPNTE
jgi:hypothetical protein